MTWHQHAVVIFLAELEQASCKPELLSRRLVVPRGNFHLRVRNNIHTLPSPALIFLHMQIIPNRSIVLNFGIIPGSFGLFYTLIELLGFNVHNSKLNYKHMLECTKVG